jgi:hypothetical protein
MEPSTQPATAATANGAHGADAVAADGVDPLVEIIATHDAARFAERLADDVVFHSPAARFTFQGKAIAADLFAAMARKSDVDRWEILDFWDEGETHVLAFRATIGGRQVDLMNISRHDERGQIRDLTVYARPMASIAIFPAFVFPSLVARHRGRVRSVIVWLLCRPLPWILERGVAGVLRLGQPRGASFDGPLR